MATASTMIVRALQMLGDKQLGDTLSSAEQSAYLDVLNGMLESWSLDRLFVYQILQENFSLVAGTTTYTIGSGATFNTTRPTKIIRAFVRDASNYDSPVTVINDTMYDAIGLKSVGRTYPDRIYYNQGYDSSGYATIYVYPSPSANLSLYIDSWKQLQQFSAISTTVALPPGYRRAIESNLAMELAPGYTNVSPEVAKIAAESRALIKSVNLPAVIARPDLTARRRRVSILTGP